MIDNVKRTICVCNLYNNTLITIRMKMYMWINVWFINIAAAVVIVCPNTNVEILFSASPHDEHRSSGPRPAKLCSDKYIFRLLRTI